MARFARQLADGNPQLGARLEVVHAKIEEAAVPQKVFGSLAYWLIS
jgi:hypothetical protein